MSNVAQVRIHSLMLIIKTADLTKYLADYALLANLVLLANMRASVQVAYFLYSNVIHGFIDIFWLNVVASPLTL